ncbi:hypothetical protein OHA21_09100 [Actinoplanes sp. NBC_00393]|uniref:hypothetical protein n=1 Tax=Actinoplanes sp. NBC_00393 TaxID=2975953 RepID=UPI002E2427B4
MNATERAVLALALVAFTGLALAARAGPPDPPDPPRDRDCPATRQVLVVEARLPAVARACRPPVVPRGTVVTDWPSSGLDRHRALIGPARRAGAAVRLG